MSPIEWQENALFAPFQRDLVRRRRRPGLYPRTRTTAAMSDALEQLCGGATVVAPPPASASVIDLPDPEEA